MTTTLQSYTVDVETYSTGYAVVRASGEFDMGARAEMVEVLDSLLDTDVHVDLSAVTFMYSGAANAVIDAAARSRAGMRVFAPTRPVAMIFQALGAADLLTSEKGDVMPDTPEEDVEAEETPVAERQSFLEMFLDADRRHR